jgi:hypothetical protein
MIENLQKFEEKQKKSLMQTIWSKLRIWLDDLVRTIWFWEKSTISKNPSNRISTELDRYENKKISQSKPF